MEKQAHVDHIYLSPHLDDAVLSCGGLLALQDRAGQRTLVATFFAASPDNAAMTAFSRELQDRWDRSAGMATTEPVALRRREDLAAVRRLNATAVHLPFLDCVYRTDPRTGESLYSSETSIFGDVHPVEEGWEAALLDSLRDALGDWGDATFYAPATAGHHVDHILVRRLALTLLRQGQRVLFYEDYPYAGDAETVGAALGDWPMACWSADARFFDEEALWAKGDAVACYTSQISTFWRSLDEMREALRVFGHRAAANSGAAGPPYAETYWTLAAGCL
jgi:LmbE family N-acetylglucosaminyl deacetylase